MASQQKQQLQQQQTHKPQIHHIDGPMLPHLNHFSKQLSSSSSDDNFLHSSLPRATTSLVPILTPPIKSSSNVNVNVNVNEDSDKSQYLLVPNPQRIVVRSAHHGKRICHLTPPPPPSPLSPTVSDADSSADADADSSVDDVVTVTIRAVTLVWLPIIKSKYNNDQEEEEEEEEGDDVSSTSTTSSDKGSREEGEWVILAGCNNGYIYEWPLANLMQEGISIHGEGQGQAPRRAFQLTCTAMDEGSCLDLIHLTSPTSTAAQTDGNESTVKYFSSSNGGVAILYGLIKGRHGKNHTSSTETKSSVVRCAIPPYNYNLSTYKDSFSLPEQIQVKVKPLVSIKSSPSKDCNHFESSQNKYVCLKKKDEIFGLLAAYRPSSSSSLTPAAKMNDNDPFEYMMTDNPGNTDESKGAKGDVFLVMCASHGLIFYRDSIGNNIDDDHDGNDDDMSTRLVHFTKSIKLSSQYYSKEQMSLSAMAISPNVKDLAIGRANGHIEVFDNVFENVDKYFNLLLEKQTKMTATDSASNLQQQQQQHPEVVTVRRTMHWHAHPVRALAFLTAYGQHNDNISSNKDVLSFANPMTLLSGGDESVLVSWQLDRNYHKPSNFVARVGQGGIVHTLYCPRTSRVIVFCCDNSIQCYNGSNYEREWMEQGLASMALQYDNKQGDEKGSEKKKKKTYAADDDDYHHYPKRGPIIMVKDPITKYPMLTNLPGSPGMVHWYNTESASVVGTLEVAPYNRVSRRDPTVDPEIPAPTIKHLAVGQDGKDLVTVDMVWTENTSVGASYDLVGPQGDLFPMNVCTNIKFWTYIDNKCGDAGGNKSDQRKRRNGDVPMSYELVSSMVAPHGRESEVCALAVAPNGRAACTLSHEEDAFRVWVKRTYGGGGGMGVTTLWKCLYKVKTPSGYSNILYQRAINSSLSSLVGGQQLVTFSSDGTVLSVSYGPYVTLWDYTSATLLTSMSLDDNNTNDCKEEREDITAVNFLTKNDDSMLITSASQFGIKSPFGGFKGCYLGEDEWSFDAGSSIGNWALVSDVVPLYDFKEGKSGTVSSGATGYFAVLITLDRGSKSIISVISRDEGNVVCIEGTDTPIQWKVGGEVQRLCLEKSGGSFVKLLAITKDCQLLSLRYGLEETAVSSTGILSTRNACAQAPVLKIGTTTEEPGDKTHEPSVKKQKISIGMSRLRGSDSVSGFDFPALSGKFTSSFIAKSLGKR